MKDSNNSVKTERIEGTIHHVVYESADDGYCVLKVDTGQKYPITIVGHCAQPNVGQHIAVSGHWIENNQYGKPFIKLHGKAKTIFTNMNKTSNTHIEVSLSDEKKYAIANVIIYD